MSDACAGHVLLGFKPSRTNFQAQTVCQGHMRQFNVSYGLEIVGDTGHACFHPVTLRTDNFCYLEL